MGEAAKSFQDLVVWQKSHRLVLDVYRMTTGFPPHELYRLTSQIRRAAVSVPANIAEGLRKRGKPDKARFMNTAQGSLEDILANDLGYAEVSSTRAQLDEVSRMLDACSKAILTSDS